ncbi:MAG: DNA repair protein RadC [Deltaproteobacteria bacterium]|nr:DNA repair protein RadC [Deltaproteobacteria bacterium]
MNLSNSNRDKPRERLQEKGVAYLGDAELVAILLGTGIRGQGSLELASQTLGQVGGVVGLSSQGMGSLCRLHGMGTAKSARLLAAVELGARVIEKKSIQKGMNRFTCSRDIFLRYNGRMSSLRQEVFLVVGLNNKNEVLTEQVVAMGTVDECRVNPREVFRPLIIEAVARTLLIHNHPSGDPSPSPEDVRLTSRLASVGKLLGIPVLDHLVIGANKYCSLRDLGLMSIEEK